jgi:MFS family permease
MLEKLLGVAFALLAAMLVGLTLFIVLGVGGYLWDEHRLVVVSIACGGAAVAALFRRRARPSAHEAGQQQARIHPGISMHAIPIGGGIGLVFAIGYVVMFWFGAPGYRPIVLGTAMLGGLLGTLLIWFRRRPRSDRGGTSMLHLDRQSEAAPEQIDEPEKGPDGNALPLTSGPWLVGPAHR